MCGYLSTTISNMKKTHESMKLEISNLVESIEKDLRRNYAEMVNSDPSIKEDPDIIRCMIGSIDEDFIRSSNKLAKRVVEEFSTEMKHTLFSMCDPLITPSGWVGFVDDGMQTIMGIAKSKRVDISIDFIEFDSLKVQKDTSTTKTDIVVHRELSEVFTVVEQTLRFILMLLCSATSVVQSKSIMAVFQATIEYFIDAMSELV